MNNRFARKNMDRTNFEHKNIGKEQRDLIEECNCEFADLFERYQKILNPGRYTSKVFAAIEEANVWVEKSIVHDWTQPQVIYK